MGIWTTLLDFELLILLLYITIKTSKVSIIESENNIFNRVQYIALNIDYKMLQR